MKTLIVFAISLGVIGASELWKEDIEKHVEKWMRLKEMDCNYLRSNSNNYISFELDGLVDARPAGYRAKLQLYVVGEKEVYIAISENETTKNGEYYIVLGEGSADKTVLRRRSSGILKEDVRPGGISLAVPTNVVIAVTNDGVVTVTVEGDTIINYYDPNPYTINNVKFATYDRDVKFYFNCTTTGNDDAMNSVDHLTYLALIYDLLSYAPTIVIVLITFFCAISCNGAQKNT